MTLLDEEPYREAGLWGCRKVRKNLDGTCGLGLLKSADSKTFAFRLGAVDRSEAVERHLSLVRCPHVLCKTWNLDDECLWVNTPCTKYPRTFNYTAKVAYCE